MTDAEWAVCPDPWPMLDFADDLLSERKWRLFAVACVRRVWPLTALAIEGRREDYRRALDAAERYADGEASLTELAHAHMHADDNVFINTELDYDDSKWVGGRRVDPFRDVAAVDLASFAEIWQQVQLLVHVFGPDPHATGAARWHDREQAAEEKAQADLLRDLIGDVPLPAPFHPAWRTESAVGLAEAAYNGRDFGVLPVLADAIEEAGCDDAALLAHLRGPGPHVRGCWAVDAVLGRS